MIDEKLCLEGLKLLEKETRAKYRKAKIRLNDDPIKDISELHQDWNTMTPRQRAANINRMADLEVAAKNRLARQIGDSFNKTLDKESNLRVKLDMIIMSIKNLEWQLGKTRRYVRDDDEGIDN